MNTEDFSDLGKVTGNTERKYRWKSGDVMNEKEPRFPICRPLGQKQMQCEFFTRAVIDFLKSFPMKGLALGDALGNNEPARR